MEKKELIFMGSVNRALRAKEILQSYGYKVFVERGKDIKNGCGYGIITVDCSREKAISLLREKGLNFDIPW